MHKIKINIQQHIANIEEAIKIKINKQSNIIKDSDKILFLRTIRIQYQTELKIKIL